jgi:hypothetical protein
MLNQLFEKINSELLNDEVKLEMTAMFESAVNAAIEAKETELEESNKVEISEFKDTLTTKLDEYLTYFVEEFTQENEQQVENAVKIKTAEKVLSVFEGVVNDFNMKLSDDVVTNEAELEEAKATINSQTEELLETRKELEALKVEKIVEGIAAHFEVESDQEKFREIAKTITFNGDTEEFKSKLVVLGESIVNVEEDLIENRLDEEIEDTQLDEENEPTRMTDYLTQLV